jgi:hypothetical protein
MIQYRIYKGDASGGPIDYSTPVATVSGLTWTGAALAVGTTTRFGVRAYDTVTGLDDNNRDVVAEVVVDPSGADASGYPAPVAQVSARPRGAATINARWTHALADRPTPTQFRVWATPGDVVDWTQPPAGVAAVGQGDYVLGFAVLDLDLPGLTPGTAYAVGVRAVAGGLADRGTAQAQATLPATTPQAPRGLSLTASQPAGHGSGRAIPGTAP